MTVWLDKAIVTAMHDELLSEHGGLPGIKDAGALEGALMRPQNLEHYSGDEQPSLAELAAAYGFAINKAHAFNDANKRTALTCIGVFLRLNGYRLTASNVAAVATMIDVATNAMDEATLADWITRNMQPL